MRNKLNKLWICEFCQRELPDSCMTDARWCNLCMAVNGYKQGMRKALHPNRKKRRDFLKVLHQSNGIDDSDGYIEKCIDGEIEINRDRLIGGLNFALWKEKKEEQKNE